MVKIERTQTPPASLEIEAKKANGSYSENDVWELLTKDFHNKCYLCENNKATSVEIEHLVPHKDNTKLKFDWNNLFFSCAHCNSMKNKREYDGRILDCSKVDPENYLLQMIKDGHVCVEPLNDYKDDMNILLTAKLLTECFENKNTGARIHECQVIFDELTRNMNVLYRTLASYRKKPTAKFLGTLRAMLNRTYKFSGFSRTYVRLHLDEYPDLAEFVQTDNV